MARGDRVVLLVALLVAACTSAPLTRIEVADFYRDYSDALKAGNAQMLAPETREALTHRRIEAARGLQRAGATDVRSTGFMLEAQTDASLGRNAEALAVLDRFDPSDLPAGLQAEYAYVRGCVGFPIAPETAGHDLDRAVALAPTDETRRHFEQMRRSCRHEATAEDNSATEPVRLTP